MTAVIFNDWYENYFYPTVKRYCKKENLNFNILLLIDNAPSHSSLLLKSDENIRIIFLPPNTTSLIQPMDQGIISSFKRRYLRNTIRLLIDKLNDTESVNENLVHNFWKGFNTKNGIDNISKAWDEVTVSTMKNGWKPLSFMNEYPTEHEVFNLNKEIMFLAEKAGLSNFGESDIQHFINTNEEPLSTQDLIDILEKNVDENSSDE
ncbi:tigger transposable element-derived protein 1-like [Condylostylus longicornis]|uniref:tigger transposable element-derived protein 1-like n=1 Tax=Condylostylus longicornis TaxID=2530218 RepID=UPI00244DFF4E|nr:tigger transposable element-derived protein 1-like [Condylostylus longicornis]